MKWGMMGIKERLQVCKILGINLTNRLRLPWSLFFRQQQIAAQQNLHGHALAPIGHADFLGMAQMSIVWWGLDRGIAQRVTASAIRSDGVCEAIQTKHGALSV